MDRPALPSEHAALAPARPVFKLMFLAQLGFVAVSLCLSVIAGYFAGTVHFVNALLLFVTSGAVATLAWRYVGTEVKRLDDADACGNRQPDFYVVR